MFGSKVYVRISRDRLLVRDVVKGREIDEPALMALSREPKRVLATGAEAQRYRADPSATVVNPFAHPRTPLSDYTIAEVLLKAFVEKLGALRFPGLARIVMSLDQEPDGGLTQIEIRAMKELGTGVGARESIVWSGPRLSDEQVAKLQFPTTGEVLQ